MHMDTGDGPSQRGGRNRGRGGGRGPYTTRNNGNQATFNRMDANQGSTSGRSADGGQNTGYRDQYHQGWQTVRGRGRGYFGGRGRQQQQQQHQYQPPHQQQQQQGGRGRGGRGHNRNRGHRGPPRPQPQPLPEDIELVTELKGHKDKVTVLSMDEASGQLFTGSHDGTVQVWSCGTGECVSVVDVGGEVDALLIEAGFLFVGLRTSSNQGLVKAWNMATNQEYLMQGHTGQVLALAAAAGLLFSGAQDATIRAWKFNGAQFECGAILTGDMGGHAAPVSCLCASGPFLFSADFKGGIKVWDVAAGVLRQSVDRAHSGASLAVITDIFVWQNCLFSGSLDGRIKVWEPAAQDSGTVISPTPCYVFPEEQQPQSKNQLPGILALAGLTDPAGKAVLMASYNAEMAIRLWELPSFEARGVLSGVKNARAMTGFSKQNLLISGDEQGLVKIWRWKAQPSVTAGAF